MGRTMGWQSDEWKKKKNVSEHRDNTEQRVVTVHTAERDTQSPRTGGVIPERDEEETAASARCAVLLIT